MRQGHRVASGGAFGLLLVAGIAVSGAFACTRDARMTTSQGIDATAAPGQQVTVTSTSFASPAERGPITFQWLAHNGQVLSTLATITSASAIETAPGATASYVTETNTTTLTFTVPASATTQPPHESYWVRGLQRHPHNGGEYNAAVRVFIPEGYGGTTTRGGGAATDQTGVVAAPAKASITETRNATAGGDGAASVGHVVAAPEQKLAPPVSDLRPSAPQVAAVRTAPGAPAVTPAGTDVPTEPVIAEPRELQLWSGLRSSASPSTLLDGPQAAAPSGGSPAGVILLSMGVFALGGTGALAGWRRLAVVKAGRR